MSTWLEGGSAGRAGWLREGCWEGRVGEGSELGVGCGCMQKLWCGQGQHVRCCEQMR